MSYTVFSHAPRRHTQPGVCSLIIHGPNVYDELTVTDVFFFFFFLFLFFSFFSLSVLWHNFALTCGNRREWLTLRWFFDTRKEFYVNTLTVSVYQSQRNESFTCTERLRRMIMQILEAAILKAVKKIASRL